MFIVTVHKVFDTSILPNAMDRAYKLPRTLVAGCTIIVGIAVLLVLLDQYIRGWHLYQTDTAIDGLGLLVAALAFWGVASTVMLQNQELALQRQELSETRKELQRQAEAQEQALAQSKGANLQSRLGNIFPQFLKVYSDAIPDPHEHLAFAATVEFSIHDSDDAFLDLVRSRHILRGLYRISMFCDLVLSTEYAGSDLDRRAYATIIATELRSPDLGILGVLAGKAIPERLLPLVQLLYVYGDLAARIPAERKGIAQRLIEGVDSDLRHAP